MKTLDYLGLDKGKVNKVVEGLNVLLADFQQYYTNLHGYHWNIQGDKFFTLHAKFEELYDDAAAQVDVIAERILQLGYVPEHRYSKMMETADVKEAGVVACGHTAASEVLEMLKKLICRERQIIADASEAGDEVTVSLLSDCLVFQEKQVWMLVAFLDCPKCDDDSCESGKSCKKD